MEQSPLTNISPIDGRYQDQLKELQLIFSEFGLMRFRVEVEIKWIQMLFNNPKIFSTKKVDNATKNFFQNIYQKFNLEDAKNIKDIEKITNHDVKSIEYFIKEKLTTKKNLEPLKEFIHFGCTSEDINNIAYGLMLKTVRNKCLAPVINNLISILTKFAHDFAAQPMLARTHGQPASPTTLGKEMANFSFRLQRQYDQLLKIPIMGKFNGAVGNYNALLIAYPNIDWITISKEFVNSFDLEWNEYTTQIEPHDYMAELFDNMTRLNTILLGFVRDIWGYISIGYFEQKPKSSEVGSSTMPHKINPINFENAEGNLGLANALFHHFSTKLLVSRFQRDLSDSTVLRNIGLAFAYSLLAYKSIILGLNKLNVVRSNLNEDLANNWEILAEAVQTIMRCHKISNPYEKLKEFTRGKKINRQILHAFIDHLELPDKVKRSLKQLTPKKYIGNAKKLAQKI